MFIDPGRDIAKAPEERNILTDGSCKRSAALGSVRYEPTEIESFPFEVTRELKTYVYRLIDPRNGETFYVGKGKGDRVFSHIRGEQKLEGKDTDVNKLKRIREIRLKRFEVGHVIHRHGMDDKTASEVEAALIDAYPGLTNIVGGVHSDDYGVMHASEIITRYSAKPAVFQHRALLISVNRSATETSPYDAVRYAWKISKAKARQAQGQASSSYSRHPAGSYCRRFHRR